MTTSQYGVDLWPYAWESQQSVGNLNRMIEWNAEQQRERGWCKVYGIDPGDGCRDLCVVDRQAVAQLVSANALLTTIDADTGAILTRLTTYNTKELVFENLADVNLPAGGGLTALTAILDIRTFRHLFVIVGNTGGANNVTALYANFYEAAIGAYTPQNLGAAITILPGGAYNYQLIPIATVTMSQTELAAPYMRIIAGSTNGTTCRCHVWGIRC
jgi:hypothetical protein